MEKEDRAFRRLITEAIVAGPQKLTREEIHDSLGISSNIVAEARKTVERREKEAEERPQGRPIKSRIVTSALQRRRKTTKFCDKLRLVRRFYLENSTPTSRKRDVVKVMVSYAL